MNRAHLTPFKNKGERDATKPLLRSINRPGGPLRRPFVVRAGVFGDAQAPVILRRR
jgi:hypothetical protein